MKSSEVKAIIERESAYGPMQFNPDHGYALDTHFTGPSYKGVIRSWDIPNNAFVLDIACGQGEAADYIEEEHKATVVRTDLSILPLQMQVIHAQNKYYAVAEATCQPFAPGTFDAIHLKDALIHIEDKEGLFKEVSRLLRQNGKLLVTTQQFDGNNSMFVNLQNGEKIQYSFCSREGYAEIVRLIKEHNMVFMGKSVRYYSPPYFDTKTSELPVFAKKFSLTIEGIGSWHPGGGETDWLHSNRKIFKFYKR